MEPINSIDVGVILGIMSLYLGASELNKAEAFTDLEFVSFVELFFWIVSGFILLFV